MTNFVKLDDRLFTKQELNVDNLSCKEDLIEKINNLEWNPKNFYEIILMGNRQFEINTREILKLIEKQNILKMKDNTQIGYNIEKIAQENNLRGIFVREVIKQYQNGKYTEEQIKKAIEVGLNAMS